VDSPGQVASLGKRRWRLTGGLVSSKTDPEVPPLPPHITLKQAKAFVATLWKASPKKKRRHRRTARQILSSILPGGDSDKN